MSSERHLQERAAETFQAFKDRVTMDEAKRAYLNGKRYVKTHPVAAIAVSLSAGILLGYLAKALVDHRRLAEARNGSSS